MLAAHRRANLAISGIDGIAAMTRSASSRSAGKLSVLPSQ
jgi:hypothetical protein